MKKFSISLVLFGLLTFAQGQMLTQGLKAYYPFNGNANDYSGNGYHGTLSGPDITVDRFNNLNSAYSFDGIGDFIDLGDILDTLFVTYPVFSVSVWIQPISINGLKHIICKSATATCSENQRQWALRIKDGHVNVIINYDKFNNNYDVVECNNAISNNQWHHIVFLYNGNATGSATNKVSFYIDGEIQAINLKKHSGTMGQMTDVTAHLGIGNNISSYGFNCSPNNFYGNIDELAIFNRLITLNEIKYLYYYGKEPEIVSQPTNQDLCKSENAHFEMTAIGDSLTYQWFYNNSPITSGTSKALTIFDVDVSDSGSYYCRVSNPWGTVQSNVAILQVFYTGQQEITGSTDVTENNVYWYSVKNNSNYSYNWYIEGGNILTGNTSNSIQVQWGQKGTGLLKLAVSASNCPADTTALLINIGASSTPENDLTGIFQNNLVHDRMYFNQNTNMQNFRLRIFDMTGHVIAEFNTLNNNSVNLGNLKAGIYVIQISDSKNVHWGKILKD